MDLSIKALKKYAERSLEMGYPRNSNILSEFIIRLKEGRDLTEGQKRYASAMAMRVRDEKYERFRRWEVEIKDDEILRERLEVVAKYYSATGYYTRIALSTLNYLQGVSGAKPPCFEECQKMINNDYARNVWESHKAKPKFQVGDLVAVRGGHPNVWLVIAIGAKPINTSHKYNDKAGGTKRYDLLEVGGDRMITRMEKNLKKHRVPKTKKRTKNDLPK